MKDVQEFIKTFVSVEFVTDSNCWGHYPFQMFVEKSNGEVEVAAMMLGGQVAAVYSIAKKHMDEKPNKLFLSVDFPGRPGDDHDLVVVFSVINGILNVVGIPYFPKSGQVLPQITESLMLDTIKNQFQLTVIAKFVTPPMINPYVN